MTASIVRPRRARRRACVRRSARAFAFAFCALAAAACADRTLAPPVDDAVPPEVRAAASDWPLPGRDYRNSRATFDSPIRASSFGRLAVAWEAVLPARGAYGAASTTPLVLGDTVYIQDLQSDVLALDRATGAERWRKIYNLFTVGPNGVAVGWGKLYANKGTRDLAALDLATGEEIWTRTLPRTPTEGIDIQPTVYANLVFASTVPVSLNGIYQPGDRGVLHALDDATGATVWSFDTVPADLWGHPEVNSGGGSWFPPAIDRERGRILWGIANPAPFPGTPEFPNGTSRPGPNLYTESLVALDVRSGALDWYRQAIQHDIFDHDLVHALLVDVNAGGTTRTVAVATGKLGRVIGHDRDTGELLWETPVGVHRNDELTALTGPTAVLPGTFGGVITPPAAANGVVYVATINAPTTLSPNQPAYIGSQFGTMPGEVVAIDAATGAILWDVEVDGDPFGGATVVNDLVLTATFQGSITALDRATGREVGRIAAAGGMNGWPAIAGDTIFWPVGLADPPRLVAYRLGAG
ncbi:MAG TPA: PQQ-binding-like beta-propeller repeat protein [Candidatus Binatia bacterium]|nr:PQQ-binding-like beta-propeller repeat protein [Candidatus Binatia bacterium]